MSIGVVIQLEMIDIDKQDRKYTLAAAIAAAPDAAQSVIERASIEQAGEAINTGQLMQLLFGFKTFAQFFFNTRNSNRQTSENKTIKLTMVYRISVQWR